MKKLALTFILTIVMVGIMATAASAATMYVKATSSSFNGAEVFLFRTSGGNPISKNYMRYMGPNTGYYQTTLTGATSGTKYIVYWYKYSNETHSQKTVTFHNGTSVWLP